MADAFRGLTLRLGADARPLQSAISSISKSAGEAQRQMNRLSKALKFDGTNAALMQSRIDLMGDKALHSSRAIAKISTAMKQAVAESRKLDGTDLRQLAQQTTKAHAATQNLRDEYNHVNAELAQVYDAVARSAQKMEKFRDIHEATEYVKMLREQMRGVGEAAEWAGNEFSKYLADASKSSKINEMFGQQKGDVKALSDTVDQLTDRHKELNAQYDKMNAVQGYRAMRTELVAYYSEVKQAASETARFRTELHALGTGSRLSKNISEIKLLGEATDKAVADAHQMIDAYRAFPKSIGAAQAKMRAVAAAEEAIAAKTSAIKAALVKIQNDPAFDKQAAYSQKAYTAAVKVEQEYAQLATALSLAEGKADELRKSLNTKMDAGVDQTSNEFKELQARVDAADERVSRLKAKLNSMDDAHATAALTTQFRSLDAQLAEATVQAAALHSQVSKLRAVTNIGKGFREFGFGMYASLTPAIMMAGRYAIQAAEDTDKAYRDMRKTVNGTEEQFEHLREAALEFSTTHVTTAETMLEIEAMGGQLGIQVENLEAFAHTVSNLDIATNMDADTISEQLGKMATVMGMSVDDYDSFGDSLVRLGNNMPALEGDIMTITTRFMGMGKVVGMAPDQMLAWATAATATGQKAEAAGSSMLRFISNMETAVNGSEEDLTLWANVAGMNAADFKAAFEEDASGAMYKFIEGLGAMQREGESVNQKLKELGINNVRDKQLLEGLANQMANATEESNVLADALRMSAEAWSGQSSTINGKVEQAGDAAREAERKSEGFSGAMQKMRNQATMLANSLAEGAAPIIQDLGSLFGDLANAVQGMPAEFKTFVVGAMGFLAAIGPLSVGVGTFLQSIEKVVGFGAGVQGFFVNAAAKVNMMTVSTERGMKANLAFQKVLRGLASPKVLIGAAAVAGGIKVVADSIGEAVKRHSDYEKATDGLAAATKRTQAMSYYAAKSTDALTTSASANTKSWTELAAAQADNVDAMNARSDAAEAEVGQLLAAKQAIQQYADTDLSGNLAAQGKLAAAIQVVNEKCGTNYELVDALNGKIADEEGVIKNAASAIGDYIAKMEQKIQADKFAMDYSDLSMQFNEQVKSLAKQQSILDKMDAARQSGNDDFNQADYDAAFDEYMRIRKMVEGTELAMNAAAEAMATVSAAADGQVVSLSSLVSANSLLNSAFSGLYGDAGERALAIDALSVAIENAGVTEKEFSALTFDELSKMASAWQSSNGNIETTLAAAGLSMRSMGEQFKQEITNATGSAAAWDSAIKTTGLKSDELATSLVNAGVSATAFSQISSEAFAAMWQSSGQSFEGVAQQMSVIDALGFQPKEIKVNSEGLLTAKNKVIEFDGEMAHYGERTFKLNVDTGRFEEVKADLESTTDETATFNIETTGEEQLDTTEEKITTAQQAAAEGVNIQLSSEDNSNVDNFMTLIDQIQSLGEIGITTSLDVDTSSLDGVLDKWNNFKSSLEGGFSGKINISKDTVTKANTDVNTLKKAVSGIHDKDIRVRVLGGALGDLRRIQSTLDTMTTYKEITIHTRRTSSGGGNAGGGNARGGVASGVNYIPRHADGAINGIVRSAMLTNIGWVGEAGAEAVLHMRNAGGAVVPLSNKRYVRPFARAVASEMGGATTSQQTSPVMNVYLDGRFVAGGVNEDTTLGELASGLRRKARA